MQDNEFDIQSSADLSIGQTIRKELFASITPMLRLVEHIEDSQVRLSLQASCLDVLTGIEDLIEDLNLDQKLA